MAGNRMDLREMAGLSAAYRAAMVESMLSVRKTVLAARIGHGTSVAALDAARAAGVKDLLFVAPKGSENGIAAQLEQAGTEIAGSCVGKKKGSAADMCREALKRRASDPDTTDVRVWIAPVNHAAEIGNWHDAWKDTFVDGPPFGMLFVLDGTDFVNDKSERGQGIRLIAKHAGRAVMFMDEERADPASLSVLSMNFGPVVRPTMTRAASNACEAMCMDG